MLYLKARAGIEILDEYEGESGKWLKTFAISDKRNKNGWRVTWESIKKRISEFVRLESPGIEYVKCEEAQCDLDHTDAATYEQALKVQEPFRVTTLRDYVLDEPKHTAYAIHKVLDDEFFEKVKRGEIKATSPSIWPKAGAFTILGKMPNGLPKIDVYDWKPVHIAFVNKPAFGDDAKIVALCEGANCKMRLLTAAELATDELAPLKQTPILVRHKNKLVFVSVSKCVETKVQEKLDKGIKLTDQDFAIVYSECGESKNAKTCTPCAKKAAAIKTLTNKIDLLALELKVHQLEKQFQ